MPKEAQEIQFALPGAPTLLEICQRLMSAKRGVSDPLPDDEFNGCVEALRQASAHWLENEDPFDNMVLAMVQVTMFHLSALPTERSVVFGQALDALSDARDAVIASSVDIAPNPGSASTTSLADKVMAQFANLESTRTEGRIYEALDGCWNMEELRDTLNSLEAGGHLRKAFLVIGRWSGNGLYEYNTRDEVPETMEDEWLCEPLEFTIGDGDVVAVYRRTS